MRYGGGYLQQSCMSVRINNRGTRLVALRRRLPPVLYDLSNTFPLCDLDHDGYYNSCTMKSCCFAGPNDEVSSSLLHHYWLAWKKWVCLMIILRWANQPCPYAAKTLMFWFLGHYKYDKCQTLDDGTRLSFTHFHWPWLYIKVQLCQTVITETFYVIIRISWNFVHLLITCSG